MAQELRPYSWMYCLIIWNYYFVERYFARSAMLLREGLIIGALNLAVIHSHALGFLAILLLGLQALVRIVETGATRRRLLGWLVIYGASALAAVPPIAVGLLRDGNLGAGDGALANLLDWMTRLIMPRGNSPLLLALSVGLYAGVVLGGLLNRQLRLTTLLFLVLPLVVATALGAIGMPIFKLNIFSTIMTPFLVLVMACLTARLSDKRRLAAAVALGLVLSLFSAQYLLHRPQTTGFRAVTEIITREGQPGDLVYVPQGSIFWGVARYFGTEQSAWHLRVAPAVPVRWRQVYDFLGPKLIGWFELEPETRWLATRAGYDMVVGDMAPVVAAQRPRVWLVSYPPGAFPPGVPPAAIGPLGQASMRSVNFLELRLYQ
ncbi:hypothetical protein [Siccirubricoccus deserti]|uniref:Uncharacterized protein n=1 Tax=Siccirubricoccus deserti TaxID=2013562 RepID=A0A9X0QY26_9PROT|nr:hypothetical protein [Siccirubricoccus deserti]MBC4015003.1 hypothetical protein [Siccirubricoccus deserti]